MYTIFKTYILFEITTYLVQLGLSTHTLSHIYYFLQIFRMHKKLSYFIEDHENGHENNNKCVSIKKYNILL